MKFAVTKQITPMWHQIFLRAIGANWLVCMACYLGMSGRDYVSKVVGIWWPTFAFVSLGLDHVVAKYANRFITHESRMKTLISSTACSSFQRGYGRARPESPLVCTSGRASFRLYSGISSVVSIYSLIFHPNREIFLLTH
jgi:hypothetical protein